MLEKWTLLWFSIRAPLTDLPIVGGLGPYAALTLAVWAVVWTVRRCRPAWWLRLLRLGIDPEGALSHFVQAAPGAIIGGLWAGGTALSVEQAAYGLLSGLGSALLHHALKAAPVAYQGALQDRAGAFAKAMKAGGLSLTLLACTACGYNAKEVECLATVEVPEDVAIAECDKRDGGKCPDAELDAIMDPNDTASENCIKEN